MIKLNPINYTTEAVIKN